MEGLSIRIAQYSDYNEYLAIRSETKNLYWTGYSNAPDPKRFQNWYNERLLEDKRDIFLCFFNEKCVGSLHVDLYDDYAEMGYSIKEAYEGQGIATRLLQQGIQLLSPPSGSLNHIALWIAKDNLGSICVAEKCDFFKSGQKRIKERNGYQIEYLQYQLLLETK